MISKDKQYRTRDGREVRIYATDGIGVCCVHGAVMRHSCAGWESMTWSLNGAGWNRPNDDLIEVRPRIKRTVWLNVYENTVCAWNEKMNADRNAHDRLACVKVEIDCEEGEGL